MNENLPYHIGWLLRDAAKAWTDSFVSRLQQDGYPEITYALANVLGFMERDGAVRQTDIATRAGLTKQAIGQFLDELEKMNLIERIKDPADARARLVRYTAGGRKFLETADHIKRQIDHEYADRIGSSEMENLKTILKRLHDPESL